MSDTTRLQLEPLGDRRTPAAVTAAFADGVLTVTGTAAADVIFVTGQVGFDGTDTPRLTVNVGGAGGDPNATEVPIAGGKPAISDVRKVVVNAGGGDDFATVDAFGLTGRTILNGGGGDDTLTGGALSGNPTAISGGAGDDTITVSRDAVVVDLGGGGNNTLNDFRLGAPGGPAVIPVGGDVGPQAAPAVEAFDAAGSPITPPADAAFRPVVLPADDADAEPATPAAAPAAAPPTVTAEPDGTLALDPAADGTDDVPLSPLPTTAAAPNPTAAELPGDELV